MDMSLAVYGDKGGSSNPQTPVVQSDSAQSLARCRMLLALGEGEFAGGLDATRIFLDGTPLGNADGSFNFANVSWDFRPGTQVQSSIPGFPAVENESAVGVEVLQPTPYVRNLTNTQIDAVVVRMGIPQLYRQQDNGNVDGTTVQYQIQIATDGGSYQTMVDKTVSEKLSSLYEISHRINLPTATTGWRLRVVRVTPDSTTPEKLQNRTIIQAVTEVIDANLRYPHTALLYVSFDAKSFNNIPRVSCKPKGRILRVPSNYDPIARTYSGSWDGVFKWAWSNNPAWVWFDILTEPRFGLGRRVTPAMLDKWELYRIAQRCDQKVPDGKGGAGTEPRFLFDCYIQAQNDAWSVIRDIAAGFNGMTFWGNNMFQVISDMPVDESTKLIVTRASIVGKPTYTSGSNKDRVSSMLVNYSDAGNHYQDRTTAIMLPEIQRQVGFKQNSITAIGCTRENEAQRRGAYAIYSNYLDRQTTFTLGLEGYGYLPGKVVFLADERVSGRVYGGRIVSYNPSIRAVTMDRNTSAVVGDTLIIRTLGGVTERRTITQVNGPQIIVATVFAAAPQPNAVFVIDAGQLRLQQMRVVDLKFNDAENTYTVTALEYNASKYDAVDTSAVLDTPVISLLPTGVVAQPRDVQIRATDAVIQGQRVASMIATWDVPLDKDGKPQADIIAYDVQWKRGDNNWINSPRTGLKSIQVDGIYEGDYLVRVRAISSTGSSSLWASAVLTHLKGRQGDVPAPLLFTATQDQVFAIGLSWAFGGDTADGAYTEAQYSASNSADNMQTLSMVPYPQRNYLQSGLKAGVTFFYRARLVDRLGNTSPWTSIVMGQSSFDADAIIDLIDEGIRDSDAFKQLSANVDTNLEAIMHEALDSNSSVDYQFKFYGDNKAEILNVKTTTADQFGAFSQTLNQVQASVASNTQGIEGNTQGIERNTAAVQQTSTALAQLDGKLSAQYGVKVAINQNGQQYIAGMQLGIQGDGQTTQSYALFNADTFAIYNGVSANNALPFVVQGGQVFIRDAFIADGAITNAKIGAFIQSSNWVAGVQGWRLDKGGTFENYGSGNGGKMKQTNTTISVADANGVLRVQIGELTGVF